MAYFTPSTKSSPPRYDLLAKHARARRSRAPAPELIREPYVTNDRNAVWVGDRIASVIENPDADSGGASPSSSRPASPA